MPNEIFAGFIAGQKIWGEITPVTHKRNVRYVRKDLLKNLLSDEELQLYAKAVGGLKRVCEDIASDKIKNITLLDRTTGETISYLDMLLNHMGWTLEQPKVKTDCKPLPLLEQGGAE